MANIAADLSLAVSGSSNNLLIYPHGAPFCQSRVLQTRFHQQTRKQNHKRIIFCKSQPQDSVSVRIKNSEIDQSATKLVGALKSEAETATLTATTVSPPPSPTYFGSPLLWVGVGVGISALFSWAAKYVKRYAMQQVFKTMMGQTGGVGMNQPGSMPIPQQPGFQFPTPPQQPGYPFPTFTPPVIPTPPVPDVDDSVTDISAQASNNRDTNEMEKEQKKPAFVDVSPEEVSNQKAYVESLEDTKQKETSLEDTKPKETSLEDTKPKETFQNSQNISGADFPVNGGAQSPGSSGPTLSMDALEKMMEDPAVQKMVYPYLPEEMRNPSTFKWMMQNPQYRKQLEDMLNNMSGDAGWDKQMVDTFKNFDLNSQEVKQQFAQVGLTPEEVVSKIMANPDVAMAFQNPRVQAALMDCSQNPMSIAKYQNDKEVMDVFNKISQLFPEMMGSP